MRKVFFVLNLVFIPLWLYAQAPVTTGGRDTVATFIRNLQYQDITKPAYGAIKKGAGPAYYYNDKAFYKIEPYFTHVACLGLLAVGGNDNITTVKNWMDWYISRASYDTMMLNYFYDQNGENETTCPPSSTGIPCNDIDAQDSDPCLFYLVAYQYYKKTGDASWFNQTVGGKTVKDRLEGMTRFMYESLFNSIYGLTIAKTTYPIYYTMDNSEVYAGLTALLKIENDIYGVSNPVIPNSGGLSIKTTMVDRFIPSITGTYKMYPKPATTSLSYLNYKLNATVDNCDGFMNAQNMYSFTPMFWPVIFGIDTDFNSLSANYIRNLINLSFPDWSSTSWTMSAASGGFWDTSLGYFFSMSSDPVLQAFGKSQAQSILSSTSFKLNSNDAASYVGDAGWLLLNLQVILDSSNKDDYILYVK
jgi:hypothetical protein